MNKQLIKGIRAFGLSEWEARAYVALTIRGALTASQLSKASCIPLSKIYEVLARLQRKSMIDGWATKPQRWRAVNPVLALRQLIDEHERNLRNLQVLRDRLLPKLKPAPSDGWSVWMSRGKRAFINRAVDMLTQANSVGVAMTGRFSRQPVLDATFKAALRRGIEIRLLGTAPLDKAASARATWYATTGATIRVLPMAVPTIAGAIDSNEAALRMDNGNESDFIWSNHPALIGLITGYFENLWARAAPWQPGN